METATVAVIGAGYVGLTTALVLCHLGHLVRCADVRAEHVDRLRDGEMPFNEPGLGEFLTQGLASGRLAFDVDNRSAVMDAAVVMICVDTPQLEDGRTATGQIEQVMTELEPALRRDTIVVIRSTVPVGYGDALAAASTRTDLRFVANPEFLREGHALRDFLHPDRIVIGAHRADAAAAVRSLFESIEAPVILTDPTSAELAKCAANSFLAAKISFANGIARLAQRTGANPVDVLRILGSDRRIGAESLAPGPGWGGGCLPKDTAALIGSVETAGMSFAMLDAALEMDALQRNWIVERVVELAGERAVGGRVALWGLAYKAGTADTRNSPAIDLARRLGARGLDVRGYDPLVSGAFEGLSVVADPYDACNDACVLLVGTEWRQWRELDFEEVGRRMSAPRVFDARGVLDERAVRQSGFTYDGVLATVYDHDGAHVDGDPRGAEPPLANAERS